MLSNFVLRLVGIYRSYQVQKMSAVSGKPPTAWSVSSDIPSTVEYKHLTESHIAIRHRLFLVVVLLLSVVLFLF